MSKKKIVLYHPPTFHEKFYSSYWIPYSLLTIASMVADKYDVFLIDGNLKKDQYDFSRLASNCLCVGISSMTGHQITGGLKFAQGIREQDPNIPIIWGGHHPSILPQHTITHPLVDIIVKGQGENVFKELTDCLEENRTPGNISGVVYKQNGTVIYNKEDYLRPKKNLPDFPWHIIDLQKYVRCDPKIGTKILNYVSSQGCPFPCAFCAEIAMYRNKWVSYGIERIIKDVLYLVRKGGVNAIKFYDANFFVNLHTVMEFSNTIVERELDISWAASGHPKTLNSLKAHQFRLLKKSDCKRLLIGAESGAQQALNIIKKKITPHLITELAKKCSDFGIVGSFAFIVGFPNCDHQEEVEKTLELGLKIREINSAHDVKIHFYAPYPGTPFFEEACKAGFHPPQTLEEWADYDYYTIETPWIDVKYEKIVHEFNSVHCPYVHL
jgi:radical SAM superfamily enzyme YgiQ (UPF0313 family)